MLIIPQKGGSKLKDMVGVWGAGGSSLRGHTHKLVSVSHQYLINSSFSQEFSSPTDLIVPLLQLLISSLKNIFFCRTHKMYSSKTSNQFFFFKL